MRSEYTRNLSRGQTLYKDQRFEEALGYFKKALMLKPYSRGMEREGERTPETW